MAKMERYRKDRIEAYEFQKPVTEVHTRGWKYFFSFTGKITHASRKEGKIDSLRERKGRRSTALKPRTEEQMVRSNQKPHTLPTTGEKKSVRYREQRYRETMEPMKSKGVLFRSIRQKREFHSEKATLRETLDRMKNLLGPTWL